MKVVAVTQRVDFVSGRDERRDALDQRLTRWLSAASLVPVPVPNRLYVATPNEEVQFERLEGWVSSIRPEGIVFSGGNDIGSCMERDLTESWLLDFAKNSRVPVLGICRGMQMLTHWAGGKLRTVEGHVGTRHRLVGRITSEVNSYHNFALADCPNEFDVLASCEDGEIEAIAHNSLPWEGWMWHPEREETFSEHDLKRINSLFR